MRKALLFFCLTALLFALCACSEGPESNDPDRTPRPTYTLSPQEYQTLVEMGLEEEINDSPYDLAFMHHYKTSRAYLLFDTDTQQVVFFHNRHNARENTPDYGTYTGDLETGITVTFTNRTQPATIRYLNADTTDRIVWLNYAGNTNLEFEQTYVSFILTYLENPQ